MKSVRRGAETHSSQGLAPLGETSMHATWVRFTGDMVARVTGPMKFRLVMQPAMAALFAIRSGLADARAGRPPYLWALVSGRVPRAALIQNAWKSVGRVFMLAVALDVVYQLDELHFVHPLQALAVAIILAIVPYVIIRGVVTRLARWHATRQHNGHKLWTPIRHGDTPPVRR